MVEGEKATTYISNLVHGAVEGFRGSGSVSTSIKDRFLLREDCPHIIELLLQL